MTCTLDCELLNTTTGEKGILEIKTAETAKKVQLEKWDGKVPDYYYAQLLHQQIACGEEYKFSTLYAKLKLLNGNSYLREYDFSQGGPIRRPRVASDGSGKVLVVCAAR